MSFPGIYSNNLDKFFRVRIVSLNKILENAKVLAVIAGTVEKTIKHINKLNEGYNIEYSNTVRDVFVGPEKHDTRMLDETWLNREQKVPLKTFYYDKLSGPANPTWPSEIDDIGTLKGNRIYFAVRKTEEMSRETKFAIIKIPGRVYGHFSKTPSSSNCKNPVYPDDVVRYYLPLIFIGLKRRTYEVYSSKLAKNAEVEIDNGADYGTVERITIGVNSRKRGEAIRMIYNKNMPVDLKKRVIKHLYVKELDILLAANRYQDHKNLTGFPASDHEKLSYPKWPRILKLEFLSGENIPSLIRQRDRFIHVPYHSFNGYIHILREAASYPEVEEIRTTLYHLTEDSKVMETSIYTTQGGKEIAAVVKLLARFDEKSNIKWGRRIQKGGMSVTFDVEGLKIHSKLLYIIATKSNLACVGIGNFHEGNAKTHTDYLMTTARPHIVNEVERVFYFIGRPFSQVRFKGLMVSPGSMKTCIAHMFGNEIRNALVGEEIWVETKINHITDPDIVSKLYAASQTGVGVDSLLRGSCSLMFGVKGISESIKAAGIINRYLRHSRILISYSDGKPEYYLGSADWMPHNLINRIEVMTPVYDQDLQQDPLRTVEYGMRNTTNGRFIDGLGTNEIRPIIEGELPFHSQ